MQQDSHSRNENGSGNLSGNSSGIFRQIEPKLSLRYMHEFDRNLKIYSQKTLVV